ncbi:hypothetical protein YC2023_066771 [Brassica napus]
MTWYTYKKRKTYCRYQYSTHGKDRPDMLFGDKTQRVEFKQVAPNGFDGGGSYGSGTPKEEDVEQQSQKLTRLEYQNLIGKFVGTFSLVFAGCAAMVVNETYGKPVTLPRIAMVGTNHNGSGLYCCSSSRINLSGRSSTARLHLNDNVCSLKGDVYVGTYPSNSKTAVFVASLGSINESSKKLRP